MESPSHQQISALVAKARAALRSSYDPSRGPVLSILPRQQRSRVDKGHSPSLWTSQVTFPAPPENDAKNAVLSAVDELGDGENSCLDEGTLQTVDVQAEWVAVKHDPQAAPKEDTEEAKYAAMMSDLREGSPTIIFVHGGAFFQNGFGTSRATASKLARESGGRVLVIDYRLAPQSAFPSQILDLLSLYLALLHPPPGSLHAPVIASEIVIAGESCGANIVLAFVQLLLHLRRRFPPAPLSFHSHRISSIPNAAGVATVSLMGEQALTLPSWHTNRPKDIWSSSAPFLDPYFPVDRVWPSQPPRADIYCTGPQLSHPLVSPCLAVDWEDAPKMWFAMGEECMWDSAALIAQACASRGGGRRNGRVVWRAYEGMPHCWPFLFPKISQSRDVLERWGRVCREMVKQDRCHPAESAGTWVKLDGREKLVDVARLTELTVEEARKLVKEKAKEREVYKGNGEKSAPKL